MVSQSTCSYKLPLGKTTHFIRYPVVTTSARNLNLFCILYVCAYFSLQKLSFVVLLVCLTLVIWYLLNTSDYFNYWRLHFSKYLNPLKCRCQIVAFKSVHCHPCLIYILISDNRALWHSELNARVPKCQKL